MKKSYGLALFVLLSASFFMISQNVAIADGHGQGQVIYTKSCMSCHKSKLAGKAENYLLEKFAHYQNGNFTSGAAKKMKDLFAKMNDAEKASLAKYINTMQ